MQTKSVKFCAHHLPPKVVFECLAHAGPQSQWWWRSPALPAGQSNSRAAIADMAWQIASSDAIAWRIIPSQEDGAVILWIDICAFSLTFVFWLRFHCLRGFDYMLFIFRIWLHLRATLQGSSSTSELRKRHGPRHVVIYVSAILLLSVLACHDVHLKSMSSLTVDGGTPSTAAGAIRQHARSRSHARSPLASARSSQGPALTVGMSAADRL